MDYVFIALTLLVAAGAPLYMFYPSRVVQGEVKTRVTYLRERKEMVYENLRDLNFEFRAGKMSETDYESLKNNMEEEAAAILAEIARLEQAAGPIPKGARV